MSFFELKKPENVFDFGVEVNTKINEFISLKKQYDEAIAWAEDIIHRIESAEMMDYLETKEPDFFCEEICSMRKHCSNGSKS